MTIDGDSLLRVLQFLLPIGVGVYSWVISQNKDAHREIKEVRDETQLLAGRIAKIEGEMVHLPDKDMVHRIELGMKDMQSRIEAQAEVVKAVERTMQRVETFLLDVQNKRPATRSRA